MTPLTKEEIEALRKIPPQALIAGIEASRILATLDTIAELTVANERLAKALTEAMNLIERFVPEDALGYNSSGDPEVPGGFQSWPLRDEYLHHMRAALQQQPEEPRLDSVTPAPILRSADDA